jgi:hypothetical protein
MWAQLSVGSLRFGLGEVRPIIAMNKEAAARVTCREDSLEMRLRPSKATPSN